VNAAGRDIINHVHHHHHHPAPSVEEIIAGITPELLGASLEQARAHEEILGMLQAMRVALQKLTDGMGAVAADDHDEQERRRDAIYDDSQYLLASAAGGAALPPFAEATAHAFAGSAEAQGVDPDPLLTPANAASASRRCHGLVADDETCERVARANPSAQQFGQSADEHPSLMTAPNYFGLVATQFRTLGYAALKAEKAARRLLQHHPHGSVAVQTALPPIISFQAQAARQNAVRLVKAERAAEKRV
jgi:hypothetical protein